VCSSDLYSILSAAIPSNKIGTYMGIFNFFIVIPEIVASLTFGPIARGLFGEGNPNTALYFVLLGGVCLLVAAALVGIVDDRAGRSVPVDAVVLADEIEPLLVPESVQPVPSSGMPGRRR